MSWKQSFGATLLFYEIALVEACICLHSIIVLAAGEASIHSMARKVTVELRYNGTSFREYHSVANLFIIAACAIMTVSYTGRLVRIDLNC